MTREEAINIMSQMIKDEEGFLSDNTVEAHKMAIKALEQEPCEDEYIKVPKKALKYRTAGMVAYNAEWLKNHFELERAVICGEQEPCSNAIDRAEAIKIASGYCHPANVAKELAKLPAVTPQPKTGHWEQYGNSWEDKFKCSECGKEQPKILCGERIIGHWSDYCPNCGARMIEPQERSDKE